MTPSRLAKECIGKLSTYPLNSFLLPGNCTIFTFHRVLSQAEYRDSEVLRSILVDDHALRKFLQHIKTKFHIISLQELIDFQKEKSHPSNQVAYACITFDDGWKDNYTNAFPVLKELEVPATIFLSTNFIGSNSGFWWQNLGDALCKKDLSEDQAHALRRLLLPYVDIRLIDTWDIGQIIRIINDQYYNDATSIAEKALAINKTKPGPQALDWSHCMEMSAHNISFGSHTLSHPRLSLLNPSELEEELARSKSTIIDKNINYVNAICYPYGNTDADVLLEAKEHYDIGFTTQPGISRIHLDSPMAIPRINIPQALALTSGRLNYSLIRAYLPGR